MFLTLLRGSRTPEAAMANAKAALAEARTKFDLAGTTAHAEYESKGEEIDALTAVITEKKVRRDVLDQFANVAYGMAESLGTLNDPQP
jgi:hypothetical protein